MPQQNTGNGRKLDAERFVRETITEWKRLSDRKGMKLSLLDDCYRRYFGYGSRRAVIRLATVGTITVVEGKKDSTVYLREDAPTPTRSQQAAMLVATVKARAKADK